MLEILRRAVRWRWPMILAVVVPATLVSLVVVQDRPQSVTATSVVGITPERTETASSDLVTLAVQRYAVVLTSGRSLSVAADASGLDRADLVDAVDVSVSPDSGNLSIAVTLPTAEEAHAAANAVADVAVQVGDDDAFMQADVLAAARSQDPGLIASTPLLVLVLVLAFLLAGLALAYAVELLRPRVRTGGDASDAAGGAPVLGSLPSFVGPWPRRTVTPDGDILRAARVLRSGLDASGRALVGGSGGATALVGVQRGSGSTTVSFLLARSVADRGESVALLDLDLERAGLSVKLGLPGEVGLDDVLVTNQPLAGAVHREGGVSVLATRPLGQQEDLVDRRLPEVLKEASDAWETVILDVAPLQGSESSEIAASHAGSAVLVVPLGALRAEVEQTTARLRRLGVPVRGVVLNRSSREDAEAPAATLGSSAPDDGDA